MGDIVIPQLQLQPEKRNHSLGFTTSHKDTTKERLFSFTTTDVSGLGDTESMIQKPSEELCQHIYRFAQEEAYSLKRTLRETLGSPISCNDKPCLDEVSFLLALLQMDCIQEASPGVNKSKRFQNKREHALHDTGRRLFCDAEHCESAALNSTNIRSVSSASDIDSLEINFKAISSQHWVMALKLGVASLFSYRYLHITLSLLRESSPHPVLLYCLNHSSTLQRLRHAQESRFLEGFLRDGFLFSKEPVVTDVPDTYLEQNLSQYNQDILKIVAPSITRSRLAKCISYIQSFLGLESNLACEIFLSLLLRRRASVPFSTLTSVSTKGELVDVARNEESLYPFVRLLRMEFIDVDLLDFDSQPSFLKREIVFIFTEEVKCYFDCLALLASLNIEPYLLWTHCLKEQATRESPSSHRGAVNTFYRLSSTSRGSKCPDAFVRLHVFSLLILHHSIDFKTIFSVLWQLYIRLSSLDPKVLDFTSVPMDNDSSGTEEAFLSDRSQNFILDPLMNINYLFFRTTLLLSASLLGCITSFFRFQASKLEQSNLNQIYTICDVITKHYYVGLLHHFAESTDDPSLEAVLCNHSSLVPLVTDLRCASLGLVIVLHQHHRNLGRSDLSFLNCVCDMVQQEGGLPHQFTMFHNMFPLLNLHPSFTNFVQPIGEITHALLCADMTQLLSEVTLTNCTPSKSISPQETQLCQYALSVIPSQCLAFSRALQSIFSSPCLSREVTEDVDNTFWGQNGSLILWEFSSHSLPTFESLGLAPGPVDRCRLLPSQLMNESVCFAYSVGGVLRHVFFDLIHKLVSKVQLSECYGVQGIIEFCNNLFQADEEVARRVFSSNDSVTAPVLCGSSFWTLVVEQYFLKYIPYSFFSLTQTLHHLLPKRTDNECTANHLLNQRRFYMLMDLLVSPLTTICFPPLAPGIRPVFSKNCSSSTQTFGFSSPSYPQQQNQCSSQHFNEKSTSCIRSLHAKNESPVRPLETHQDIPYEASSPIGLHYVIKSPLVVEFIVMKMLGIEPAATNLTHETILNQTLGHLVPMPLEPVFFYSVDFFNEPMELSTPCFSSVTDEETNRIFNKTRRYCGSVWATAALTSQNDRVQDWSYPIDLYSLEHFIENFQYHRRKEAQLHKKDTQEPFTEFIVNPFGPSRETDVQRIHHEALLAYEMLSLAPGEDPPYTLQWDLTSSSSPLTLLQLLWTLWSALLYDLDHSATLSARNTGLVNLLLQIVSLFVSFVGLHSMSNILLARFLSDEQKNEIPTPLRIFLRFFDTLRVTVNISKQYSLEDELPECFVMLCIASFRLVSYGLRPIHLDDIRSLLVCSNAEDIVTFFWNSLGIYRASQLSLTLQPLGPATSYMYLHWLFCLLSSPLPSSLILDGKYLPILSFNCLVSSVKRCVTHAVPTDLSYALLFSALELVTSLLNVTPLTAWTRSFIDEALTVSQLTRESLNLLIRSQNGMEGDWNLVDHYLKSYELELWQILTCLLPPSAVMYSEDGFNGCVQRSLLSFRADMLTETHSTGGFQMFTALLDVLFHVGWTHACSSLHVFNTFERIVLLRQIMRPLNGLVLMLTWFNSQEVDVKCEDITEDPFFFSKCISGVRAIQQHILNTFFEHNVFSLLAGMLVFQGFVSVQNSGKNQHITQTFVHTLVLESYIADLLNAHRSGWDTLASINRLSWNVASYSGSLVGETKKILNNCYEFFISLTAIVYQPLNSSNNLDICVPSDLFSKVANVLEALKSNSLLNGSACNGFGCQMNLSVAPNDLFIQINHRFVLDMIYEHTTSDWAVPVNIIKSLILSCTWWGDGILTLAPFLLEWIMANPLRSTSQESVDHTLCSNPIKQQKSLVAFLLITHPPELDSAISKCLKANSENCTSATWNVLTFVERTLVRFCVDALTTIPSQLSIIFYPLSLVSRGCVAEVSLIPHMMLSVRVFHLMGNSTLIQDSCDLESDTSFCRNTLIFCLFWICRFLFIVEYQILEQKTRVRLTVDTLRMVYVSLDMLSQLFFWLDHYTSYGVGFLELLAEPCETLFNRLSWIESKDLPKSLHQLCGWTLIQRAVRCIVQLWSGLEVLRYKDSKGKLPDSDVSITESLLGRVAISSPFGTFAHQSLVAGSSCCVVLEPGVSQAEFSMFHMSWPGDQDLSFLSLPLLVLSFSRVLSLLTICCTGDLRHVYLDNHFLQTGHVAKKVKEKTFHSTLFARLSHFPDFLQLVEDFTNHQGLICALLSEQQGCLIPSSLIIGLAPSWLSTMEKRELFKILPCPLCSTCSLNPFHPFRADENQERLPVDCFLTNPDCALPKSSCEILSHMYTLLFSQTHDGFAAGSFCMQCQKDQVEHEEFLRPPTPTPPMTLPLALMTDHSPLGSRAMVFYLGLVTFSGHLWDKAIEQYFGGAVTSVLSTEEVNEYMFETFNLVELMSVLVVELEINRLKHHILNQLIMFYNLTRQSKKVLFAFRKASTSPSDKHFGHFLNLNIEMTRDLKLSMTTLICILQKRNDLCGGGCDSFFCYAATYPPRNVSYIGLLLEFVVQRFTVYWEEHYDLITMEYALIQENTFQINTVTARHGSLPSLERVFADGRSGSVSCLCECLTFPFLKAQGQDSSTTPSHAIKQEIDQTLAVLVKHLWKHCLCTVLYYTHVDTLPQAAYGFQGFTDLCRAFLLFQLVIRCWMMEILLRESNEHDIKLCLKELAAVFASAVSILTTTAATLMKTVMLCKDDVDIVAQLLVARSHTHYHSLLPREVFQDPERGSGYSSLLFVVAIPFLLMSLNCTLLDVVRSVSLHCSKKNSKSSQDSTITSHCFQLMEDFLDYASEKGGKNFRATVLCQILRTVHTFSQFPKKSAKAVDALHFHSKQNNGVLQDIMHPQSMYRSICVSADNYCHRFNIQLSIMNLSLLSYILMIPSVLKTLDHSAVASVLYLMPAVQLFMHPLVRSGSSNFNLQSCYRLLASDGDLDSGDCWRPVYERFYRQQSKTWNRRDSEYLDPSSPFPTTRPGQLLRSQSHIVWCYCLAQLASMDCSCLVECILRFQRRFYFVLEAVTQSSQLGILEEMFMIVGFFSKLPPLHTLQSKEHQKTILAFVFLILETVAYLTQSCLGRGQIEMAEVFKPISPREVSAAGLADLDTSGIDTFNEKGFDARVIFSGQPALVPSVYHQRVLVLIIKLIQRVFVCTRRLQLERLGAQELNGLELDSYFLQHHFNSHHFSFLSFKKEINTVEDIFEHMFHNALDIGRTLLQVLEEFPKQQKRIFVGVLKQSQSSIFLPLSLRLSCAQRIAPENLLLMANVKSIAGDPNDSEFPSTEDHMTSPLLMSIGRPAQTLMEHTKSLDDSSALAQNEQSCATSILSTQIVTSKQRPSSLVERSSTSSIRSFHLFELYNYIVACDLDDSDPITEGCLPMCITFSSLLHVLQCTLASSAFLGFSYFNKLTHMAKKAINVEGASSRHYNSVFERPSVVRRLTEFLTALQGLGKDRFRAFHIVLKKMMKIISLRLGDDPQLIQRER